MNTEWKSFLEAQRATIGPDGLVDFADVEANGECRLVDLSYLGLIAIRGEDTQQFLQGQLTNDVQNLTADMSQMNSLCTPKGRMLATFRVFHRADEAILLQMPRERVAPTLQRLRMFVLRAKVELDDLSDQMMRIGITGNCAERCLSDVFPELPGHPGGVAHADDMTLLRLPGPAPRFQVIGPQQALASLWQRWSADAQPTSSNYWALLDIHAGIPTIYDATAEAFVPQMTNMQLVDGVSFTKGCYTGQEIVARMQYLGKLKRRMYLAHVESDTKPAPGDPLFSPSSESGQGDGNVVDAQPAPEGGYDLLAVIPITSVEADDVRLVDAEGPQLAFRDLPYAFDSADQQQPASS